MNYNNPILAVGSIAFDDLETPNGIKKNVLGGSATYFSIAASARATTGWVIRPACTFNPAAKWGSSSSAC